MDGLRQAWLLTEQPGEQTRWAVSQRTARVRLHPAQLRVLVSRTTPRFRDEPPRIARAKMDSV